MQTPLLHVPICDLNCSVDVMSRNLCGREFHILAAVERKDLTPFELVLTWGISTVFVYLKNKNGVYMLKYHSNIQVFDYLKSAIAFSRLTFIEGSLDLPREVS